ncbi:NAD(P)H-dependent flavin oxidoreductase [Xanthobacter versatilis]|uniref:NAD(P)H-dependent flavin oxidoreductase n=1 Tax=Xanthobacter autotrophicus (strain ATCC BAA-1158 / Py2) TaxID=78245 RepID=UPI00372BC811
MALHAAFRDLAIPAIASPMFLASGPDLVVEVCRSGLVGTFPALNARTNDAYAAWLGEIEDRLAAAAQAGPRPAPYGVNLIVHKSNPRLAADIELTVKHKVPLVITSLGAVREVVDAVHSYGGAIFHDVVNMRHARKAAEAGVDGIIAVCAGAGGHAGTLSPFALIPEIASFFTGTIVLSGAMSTGRHIAAARMLGADMAYLGTRFLATRECMVPDAQKEMVVAANADDIVYTPKVSGVPANFLRQSLAAAGIDLDQPKHEGGLDMASEAKAWKNVWSAGQGVGSVREVLPAAELCRQLIAEYHAARRETAQEEAASSTAFTPAA